MLTDTEEIRIETSTHCPFFCLPCPRESFTRAKTVMNWDLFKSIIDMTKQEIPGIRNATVSGYGEFAVDPGWREKLSLAASKFDKVHVVTNLALLDENDLDFLLDHVADIRVSLYGRTDKTYRLIHRPPQNIELKSIEMHLEHILRHKNKGQRLILNYLELPENRHETESWISYWTDRADLIEVWRPHNWIDGREYRIPCSHRLSSCGRPEHGPIQVQVDGTVNVCCFDYNGELEIGDLKKQGLAEIFNDQRMTSIQAAHKEGRADEIPQCRVCDQRNCSDCKSEQLLHNSRFNVAERVRMTSTDYEIMD